MSPKRENILIVEPEDPLRQQLEGVLRSAGYEVSSVASQEEGFRIVQSSIVDVFLLSADRADVFCCNSLAEIKGLGSASNTRVILLAPGGGAERARALDMGADDVIQVPGTQPNCWPASVSSCASSTCWKSCGANPASQKKAKKSRITRFKLSRLRRK